MKDKPTKIKLPRPVKITVIVLFSVIALIAAVIIYLYIDYNSKKKEEAPDDYPQEYTDEQDIETKIDPLSVENGEVTFNLSTESERLENRMEEIRTLMDSVSLEPIHIGEVEQLANTKLDDMFSNFTVRIIGSAKTNLRYDGYHIQTQELSAPAPVVNMVVTPDIFLQNPEILNKDSITKSEIDGVEFHVFYDYAKRLDQTSGKESNRFVYEIISFYNGVSYYIRMDFRGLDYELDITETTKYNTSERVAAFMKQFVTLLNKGIK
ncbi:MAG: hypothetical protein LBR68_03750 [Lachnoclostridium sp.]|jgi:hypothetical protein|nr:hypothetical protein [Lachnoclostridium sp.]